jgi:hypothetical protein
LTGSVTITDNTLGIAGKLQSIELAGTSVQQTPTVAVAPVSIAYQSDPTLLNATIGFVGNTAPAGAVSFTIDDHAPVIATCSGAASAFTCTANYPTGKLWTKPHTITASLAADSNFTAATGTATLTVTQIAPVITFAVDNHTYGDPAGSLAATSTSHAAITYSLVSGPATVSTNTLTIMGAGTVVLQASQPADDNHLAATQNATFTVAQAALTVTASSASIVYGGAVPAITPSFTGFVFRDGAASLGTVTCSTTATSTSGTGTYPSTCAGVVNPNYAINYVGGAVTITAAPLTITATSDTMTYGGTVPKIWPKFSGLVNGDTARAALGNAIACSTTATSSSAVGSYPSSCTGAVGGNYAVNYVNGNVTVNPAALTVTASNATTTYGGTLPSITPSFAGLVNTDGPATLGNVACTTTAISASAVGSYPSSCSGAVNANYTMSYVPGSVTVNAAALVVSASNATMTYGGAVPAITPIYAGFAHSDNAASLGVVSCSTTATSGSAAGKYPTACNGAVDANYAISYVPGSVTVNAAALTITASSGTAVYGTTVPVVTPVYAGFVNGDGPSALGAITCSTSASSVSHAGTYPSTCSGAVDSNYAINYASGTIAITQATPVVSWIAPAGITYGAALSGTQLDATANVAGTFSYLPAAGTVLKAGTQPLTVTFNPTVKGDYTSSTATVNLTVNQANPVITWANPAAIAYGTVLGATQLNASANLPGTFSYSPAAGALLTGGVQPLTVTFTPTNTTDYAAQSKTVSIQVNESTITTGIASGTQTYQTWTNFVMGPTWSGNYQTSKVPTGTVTLYNNGVALTTLPLGSNGEAYYTTNPPLSVGVNNLTVSYSGDKNYPPGLSAATTITVLPAAVNFQASCYNGTLYGSSPWTCSVSLSASTTTQPGGVFTYSLDGGAAVPVNVVPNGPAAFTVPGLLAAGNHTLVLSYAAQGNYAAAAPLTRTVTTAQGSTELQVAPSSSSPASGATVTLSGTVNTPNSGVPTGSVTFYDGSTMLGTSAIASNGSISYNVTGILKGTHSYSAKYAGTSNYTAAASSAVSVTGVAREN